ncbi:MAG: TolC family protein [Tannerella sp.]|jgi:outer membrane protein TolC|nr:TolC family protein [Tannerella sp.]
MKRLVILLFAVCAVASVVPAQDSLNYYLETAAGNSPSVMAAFHGYEAALQRIPQAGAYEDPRLDMGVFLKPMDIIDGRQVAQFQLMQMFPWFGVKKAAQTEAQRMAKMSFEQFRETRDNLFLDVYRQWYVLNRLQQRLKNNRENIELLKQLETLALRRFSSGGGAVSGSAVSGSAVSGAAVSGGSYAMPGDAGNALAGGGMSGMNTGKSGAMPSQSTANAMPSMNGSSGGMAMASSSGGLPEILRIQLEIAELENSSESILSEMTAEKARFNALLNCPAKNEVIVPDTFVLTPYVFDIDMAMQLIAEQNPLLGMIREESLAYEAKEEMSRKMGYPMFGIGLQYMLIAKRSDPSAATGMTDSEMSGGAGNAVSSGMSGGMNGKDMLMPMLSVSIPLFRGKYRAARKEAQFQQKAAQARYKETLNNLEAGFYRAGYELDDAKRKITLYRKQAALARTTYDLLVQEFVSGKSDLSAVIQVQRQLSDYRLKESEAIADYNTTVATIQKMISSKNVEQ